METKPYKLLVFDWDGTLMDSQAQIIACMQAASRDLELPFKSADEVSNIIGLGLHEAVDRLYPGNDHDFHQRLADRYRHHYFAGLSPAQLFSGAEQVVRRLCDDGYLLAVATGKGRQGLDMVLEDTGLASVFHATRASDETRSKPDPLMLHELLAELQVSPTHALMVGDSEYDMEMARRAGTDALAVSYGVHAAERLLQHAPRACLDDIMELPGWLESLTRPAWDAAV